MILEKQTLFMLKLEELDGLTQMLHEVLEKYLFDIRNSAYCINKIKKQLYLLK